VTAGQLFGAEQNWSRWYNISPGCHMCPRALKIHVLRKTGVRSLAARLEHALE